MADTFTPHYNLTKPQVGGDPDTWGDLLNANFDTIDTVLFGKLDTTGGTISGALTVNGAFTASGAVNGQTVKVSPPGSTPNNPALFGLYAVGTYGGGLYLDDPSGGGTNGSWGVYTSNGTLSFGSGQPGGGALAARMTLTPGGLLTVSGNLGVNGGTVSGSNGIILGGSSAGAVTLRPNGTGSTTGQAVLDTAGSLTLAGNLVAGGAFISGAAGITIGGSSAGAVVLRPNGTGSTTGQAVLGTDGGLTLAGNLNANGNVVSNNYVISGNGRFISNNGSFVILSADNATGTVYLRPRTTEDSTGQAFVDSNGVLNVRPVGSGPTNPAAFGLNLYGNYGGGIYLNDDSGAWGIYAESGNLRFGSGAANGGALSSQVAFSNTGVVTAADFQATSDQRLKAGIRPLRDGLARLKRMLPREYIKYATAAHTGRGRPEAGFIAQEVQAVLPSAVEGDVDDGYLGVSVGQVLALVAAAVLELSERIDQMEAAHGRAE